MTQTQTVRKLTKKEARDIARFRAGLILQSALDNGWWPESLEEEHGEDGLLEVVNQMQIIATRMQGGPL